MKYLFIGIGSLTFASIGLFFPSIVQAEASCPQSIEPLTNQLLKDLPGYANRVLQRTQLPSRTQDNSTYFILAGQPEYNPLTENLQGDYIPTFPEAETETVKQVFFTTLERRYSSRKVDSVESYHWLFLTQTQQGWRQVLLYSRFGLTDKTHPPTPPKETSNGIIGKAIQLWLRDCRFREVE